MTTPSSLPAEINRERLADAADAAKWRAIEGAVREMIAADEDLSRIGYSDLSVVNESH